MVISGNGIGGTAPDRSGTPMKVGFSASNTYSIIGISLSGSGSILNPVLITKNSISNITGHSASCINLETSNANIDSNFINNIIALYNGNSIISLIGISINTSNATITNNKIIKIKDTVTSLYPPKVIGIYGSGSSQYTIDRNIIDSVIASYSVQNSGYANSPISIGISISLSGTATTNKISNNKISNIINTSFFPATGINYGGTNNSTTNIFNNQIDNIGGLLYNPGNPSNFLVGIQESGEGNDTIYNNTINIGALSNSLTSIYGIRNSSGSGMHVFYNNTVNIIGTQNFRTSSAFYVTSGNVLLKNNILKNARIRTSSSAGSYAIASAGTAGFNSDYNLLSAADSICAMWGTLPKTFAAWKIATNNDTNSVNAAITFVSATDLHIDGTNANAWNVYGRGIAIQTIGTDIDGDSRSTAIGTHVTIGADEIPMPTSTPLAIDLKTIIAKNVGNKNRIDWSTAKEIKADYFELESSTDARNFKKIAKINAKGQASAYTYWDEKAALGMNYYRLKMTMDNGPSVYSKTVFAEVKSLSGFNISAYPNPVQNKIALKIDGSIQNNSVITLRNIAGKLLQTIDVTNNEVEIDMSGFAMGIYFIKYTNDQQSQTIKITKQ